jgi:hypothetical protein
MVTKYIINNLSGQTISGDLTINGNITITGTSNINSINGIATYKTLLTQTGSITATGLSDFIFSNQGLIVGETYTVNTYESGDDFSNVADIQNGGVLTFTYSGTGAVDLTNTYSSVATEVITGSGSDADFNVVVNSGVYESVTVANNGYGYRIGDSIRISGSFLGGKGENDITVTITGLTPNSSGSVFIATGELPANWENGSELISGGGLIVDVLENTLGYGIEWYYDPSNFAGIYAGFNADTGPLYNSFDRKATYLNVGPLIQNGPPTASEIYGGIAGIALKDELFYIGVFDIQNFTAVDDALYYLPVELVIKQDTDTTPVVITGSTPSYPFNNAAFDLNCGIYTLQTFYSYDGSQVNDISDLVTLFNNNSNTNIIGVFSDNGSGEIVLTMKTNLKNKFCSSNTLTFEVFND